MNVEILSLPNDTPINSELIAEYVRIDLGQDAKTLELLVFSALGQIEGYLDRVVMQTTFKGEPDCIAWSYDLPRTPVVAVASVTVDGQALVEGTDYTVCGSKLRLKALPSASPVIVWTAGFPVVPAPITHAIAMLVEANYDQRSGIDQVTQTAVERLCAPYRRVSL